jgi:hypothetical protein
VRSGDYEEACIKRAFSGKAAETVVLASPEKISTASAERWVSAMEEKGVAVIASQ